MSSNRPAVIVLELDRAGECPAGRATRTGLPALEFHGWLGLASAIDALVCEDARDGGCRTAPTTAIEGDLP